MCSNFLTELVACKTRSSGFAVLCCGVALQNNRGSVTTSEQTYNGLRRPCVLDPVVFVSIVVIRVTSETDVPTTHFISGFRVRCVYFGMAFFFRISVEGHFFGSTSHHRHACTSFEISVVSPAGSRQRHPTCDFCFRCAFGTLGRICSGWPKNCWRRRTRPGNSTKRCFTLRRS